MKLMKNCSIRARLYSVLVLAVIGVLVLTGISVKALTEAASTDPAIARAARTT